MNGGKSSWLIASRLIARGALAQAESSVADVRQWILRASPGPRCRRCDVRSLCRWNVRPGIVIDIA